MDNKIAGLLTVFSNRGGQPDCTFVYKDAIYELFFDSHHAAHRRWIRLNPDRREPVHWYRTYVVPWLWGVAQRRPRVWVRRHRLVEGSIVQTIGIAVEVCSIDTTTSNSQHPGSRKIVNGPSGDSHVGCTELISTERPD